MRAIYRYPHRSLGHALLLLAALAGAGCASEPEFKNLSLIKAELREYVETGDYARQVEAVAREAGDYLAARAAEPRPPDSGKLAIVLDIDDTSLSTWPNLMANDFGLIKRGGCDLPQGPCGWSAWLELGVAPVIEPTLALSRKAQRLGIEVFFLTGRNEKYLAATERNLHNAGYDDWSGLIMRTTRTRLPSAADFKAPARRALVEQGYVIVVNMGDQESDLAGGYAERAFKLPNPFLRIP